MGTAEAVIALDNVRIILKAQRQQGGGSRLLSIKMTGHAVQPHWAQLGRSRFDEIWH